MVIDAQSKTFVLLFANRMGAPQGDKLGGMNPFDNSSFNYFLKSRFFISAIQKGVIYIGAVLGSNSIMKSVS